MMRLDELPRSKARPLLWIHALCLVFWVLTLGTFWGPLRDFLQLSLHNTEYNHLVVIPCISAALIYWKRREIFRAAAPDLKIGIPLFLTLIVFGWLLSSRFMSVHSTYGLTVAVLAVLAVWAAGFFLFYGVRSLEPARFPLLFLLLAIPIPQVVLDKIVLALQGGTSDLVYGLFRLAGTPLFRNGFTFELPGGGLEVTKESSSINSAWALFITGLLVGHFLLRSLPAKACLSVLTVPIAIFTNAVRIVTIWFLAVRVDPDFLHGSLHQNGGILFSLLSLALLLISLYWLRKLEARRFPSGG
jgi:exosortase